MPPSDAKHFSAPHQHPLVLLLEVAFALAIAISVVLLRAAWTAEGLGAVFTVAVWVLLALVLFPALGVGLVVARLTGSTLALTAESLYVEGPFGRWHHLPRTGARLIPLRFHLLEKGFRGHKGEAPAAWAVELPGLPAAFALTRLLYPAVASRALIITRQHTDHALLLAALQFDNRP